jgi:hypothetical protein
VITEFEAHRRMVAAGIPAAYRWHVAREAQHQTVLHPELLQGLAPVERILLQCAYREDADWADC